MPMHSPSACLALAVPAELAQTVARHALMRNALSRDATHVVHVHYDTPRYALRREEIQLCLHKDHGSWRQTVFDAASMNGSAQSGGWETAYQAGFDFSALTDDRLRSVLQQAKLVRALQPLFETNYRRTEWRVRPVDGVELRVTLDRGWIIAGSRRAQLCDLGIDLLAGNAGDAYQLAALLMERIPLYPGLPSKVERGYALHRGRPPQPHRAKPLVFTGRTGTAEAFRLVALNCLAHLHRNHDGALRGDDPEYVHQMRVASRRLRAAIRLFEPALPPGFEQTVLPGLRVVVTTLGRVRDLDVLLEDIVAPVIRALPEEPRLTDLSAVLAQRLHVARTEAVDILRQPRYGLLLLAADRLLADPGIDSSDPGPASLQTFADKRLRRQRQRVIRDAGEARIDDPASLHRLRISVKRLRYGIEFLSSLLPRHVTAGHLGRLIRLQDVLGQLNDLANAGSILMSCAGRDPTLREAVSLIAGWHGTRYANLLDDAGKHIAALKKLRAIATS